MVLIRDVVQQAITTGYLTVSAEERLRQLSRTKYDLEDLNAFMTLPEGAMAGRVRQESREIRRYQGHGDLVGAIVQSDRLTAIARVCELTHRSITISRPNSFVKALCLLNRGRQ
ncbi:MAG: hypothetical protein ACREPR_04250 [Brasilonema sp.]